MGLVGPSGGDTGKQLQIAQDYSGAGLIFDFFNDNFAITNSVGNGHWSHIACTFDNVTMERRIYIDGKLIATNIAAFGFSGPTNYFQITPAANVAGGLVDDVRFYSRALSSNEVAGVYAFESGPRVNLMKAVKPSFSYLSLGTNYQLQVSGDLNNWTNQGSVFTATNNTLVYPRYWDVDNWAQLFFRLQVAP